MVTLTNQYNPHLYKNDLKSTVSHAVSILNIPFNNPEALVLNSHIKDDELGFEFQTSIPTPCFISDHKSLFKKYDYSASQWPDFPWSSEYVLWLAVESVWGKTCLSRRQTLGFHCPFPNYAITDKCFSISAVSLCRQLMNAVGGEVYFSGVATGKLSMFLEGSFPN